MRTHRKFLPFLYMFLASLIPLFFFIMLVNPSYTLTVFDVGFGVSIFFFGMIFLSLFALFTFIFASKRRGALTSLFISGILLLRFFGLKSLFQTIILLAIILLIEYLLSRRTPRQPKKLV